jgi:cell division protein ZapE
MPQSTPMRENFAEALTDIYEARVTAGTLRADPAQLDVLPALDEIRQWLEDQAGRKRSFLSRFRKTPTAPKGVYLWGGVGRGKSMVMDLFFAATDIPRKRRVHFHAFMQEVHAGIFAQRKLGVDDPVIPVANALIADVACLCFDEMQISDITDAMLVGRLFTLLMDGGVVIVTTSNRPPEDLYKDGLNRALFLPFIALLRDRMEVMELESPTDYRQHRLTGAQVYFHPARTAWADIDAIWRDLTGGAAGEPLVLTVTGRKVTVPRFSNGVARATFWDLCAQPLGPADYLAIAGAARVLILEDIPQLSASNYNEAKRFVTLIDALYEAHVRLIASAADVPERLYLEGAGSFEFERTASRLREMQAADWGQNG